jgi:GH24 family phage-related lysozyme (muramidase)
MISSKALDLILDAEGCDLKPNWPGGASGVTYGYGYDLGYNTKEQIQKDWSSLVNGNVLAFMLSCSGIKGEPAKRLITPTSRTLRITQEAAEQVFQLKTIPRFYKTAMDAFTGLEHCPLDTIGAVVSLVFNRGAAMGVEGQPSWDSRREMREVRAAIEVQDLQGAADAIRRMKRLWDGKGLDGLITRRENESQLIESSIL